MDKELEDKRKAFYAAGSEFMVNFGRNTFNIRDDLQNVPPEWEEDNPEKYREAVKQLDDLADKVVRLHQDLVRLGRKELSIGPESKETAV